MQRARGIIAAQIPAGQVLTAIRAFPAEPNRTLWAILYGYAKNADHSVSYEPDYMKCDKMRCAVYEQAGGAYRRVEQTPILHDDNFHHDAQPNTSFEKVNFMPCA